MTYIFVGDFIDIKDFQNLYISLLILFRGHTNYVTELDNVILMLKQSIIGTITCKFKMFIFKQFEYISPRLLIPPGSH